MCLSVSVLVFVRLRVSEGMFVCVYVCMCVCVCVCLCVYNRHRDAYAAFPLQGAERIGSARIAFPPPKVGVTRT